MNLYGVANELRKHVSGMQTHWIHYDSINNIANTGTDARTRIVYDKAFEVPFITRPEFFAATYDAVKSGNATISENPKLSEHRLFSDWDFEQAGISEPKRRELIKNAIFIYESMSNGQIISNNNGETIVQSAVECSLELNIYNHNIHLKTNIRSSNIVRKHCTLWLKYRLNEMGFTKKELTSLDISSGLRMLYSGKHLKSTVENDNNMKNNGIQYYTSTKTIDTSSLYIPITVSEYLDPIECSKKIEQFTFPKLDDYVSRCMESSIYSMPTFVDVTEYNNIRDELTDCKLFTDSVNCDDSITLDMLVGNIETIGTTDYIGETIDVPTEVWQEIRDMVNPLIGDAFSSPILNENGILRYERIKPSMCMICERIHESNGMYVTYNTSTCEVALRCFQTSDKYMLVGTAGDYDEILETLGMTTVSRPLGIYTKDNNSFLKSYKIDDTSVSASSVNTLTDINKDINKDIDITEQSIDISKQEFSPLFEINAIRTVVEKQNDELFSPSRELIVDTGDTRIYTMKTCPVCNGQDCIVTLTIATGVEICSCELP